MWGVSSPVFGRLLEEPLGNDPKVQCIFTKIQPTIISLQVVVPPILCFVVNIAYWGRLFLQICMFRAKLSKIDHQDKTQ